MNHDQLVDRLFPEAGHIPGNFDQVMEQYDREKAEKHGPEAAAFAAVMDADYVEVKLIIRGMAAKDRAVLVFWAKELIGVSDSVDLDEVRY